MYIWDHSPPCKMMHKQNNCTCQTPQSIKVCVSGYELSLELAKTRKRKAHKELYSLHRLEVFFTLVGWQQRVVCDIKNFKSAQKNPPTCAPLIMIFFITCCGTSG